MRLNRLMSKGERDEKKVAAMSQFLNKDVVILKPHPKAGQEGKTVRVEIKKGRPTMVVLLESGEECFITDNKHILFIIDKFKEERDGE